MQRPLIGIIGTGRVGSALALALDAAGYTLGPLWSRTRARAERLAAMLPDAAVVDSPADVAKRSALVIVAVPDRVIEPLVTGLRWCAGTAVVHTSGGTPVAALASAFEAGSATGGWHPLKSFAGGDDDARFQGITFAVEAEDELRATLHEIILALGARAFDLRAADRARYHAAAALASNGLVALLAEAASIWGSFGMPRTEALAALLPLVSGTVANLQTLGLPDALTGPVERGDLATVRDHLVALAEGTPATTELYRLLGRQAVHLAEEKGGITGEDASALSALLADRLCGARVE